MKFSMRKQMRDYSEELKGLLAVAKGHFEPSMQLKDPKQTYEIIKDALHLVWDFCDVDTNELSRRELDVVENVVLGLSNQEVAEKLFVCDKTVKFHLTTIYRKMGIKSRSQLILEYYKNELEKARRDQSVLQDKLEGLSGGADRGCDELPSGSVS